MTAPLLNDEEDNEDEDFVEFEEIDDDDFTELEAPGEKKKQTFGDYLKTVAKDVPLQGGKGFAKGFGGAYGNIASLTGMNAPESPVEDELRNEQQRSLEVLNDPNASFMERLMANMSVTEDDDYMRRYAPLPTSTDIGELIDPYIGEAETGPGRFSERIGQFAGGSAAFGSIDPKSALIAGGAGQTAEEMGLGPGAQLVAEIVALIAAGTIKGKAGSISKETQAKIDQLRKMGYTEKEITTAINAGKKTSIWKNSKATNRSEQILEDIGTKSKELVEDVLEHSYPGIKEGGIESVHSAASKVFSETVEAGKKIPFKNPTKFVDKAKEVLKAFKEDISPLPGSQEAAIVKELNNSIKKLSKGNQTADTAINIQKRLYQLGKYSSPGAREKLIGELQNSLKASLGEESPEYLKMVEKANKGWRDYTNARKVSNLIEKTVDAEGGMNFGKMKTMVDNPRNRKVLEQALGPKQADNLYQIAKIGKDVGNVAKKFGKIDGNLLYQTSRMAALGYGLYEQNWYIVAGAIGTEAAQRLATRSLTDPKYQGLVIKGLNAIKSESPKMLQRATTAMEKYLSEEGFLEEGEDDFTEF